MVKHIPQISDCRDIGYVFTANLDGDVTCLCILQLLSGAQNDEFCFAVIYF